MKSYHAESGSGMRGINLKEHAIPKPGPHEVLLEIKANSLNARELSVLEGKYPLPVKPDVIMCADGAGLITEVGEKVTRVKVGDRVAVAMFPKWIAGPIEWEYAPQIGGSLDGLLTEFAAVNEDAVVGIPAHLSFEEAATLPCAAVTAWNALTGRRPVAAGDTVLTLGSGGVSLFAIQFARIFGARVIATTSNEEKANRLIQLGASEVINYHKCPDWHHEVRNLTGGRGVDHVVEIGGGTLQQSLQSVALNGQVNFIGNIAGREATIDTNILYKSMATVSVIFAGNRAQFMAMNRAISINHLRPVIDRVFSFDEAIEAFSYYEKTRPLGKVVISHSQ